MIAQGKTSINDCKDNSKGGGGIFLDIDTRDAKFTDTPHYLTTLEGDIHHWDTNGINCIYKATKTGFRIYFKWVYKNSQDLTPKIAKANGWYVKWTGILVD